MILLWIVVWWFILGALSVPVLKSALALCLEWTETRSIAFSVSNDLDDPERVIFGVIMFGPVMFAFGAYIWLLIGLAYAAGKLGPNEP